MEYEELPLLVQEYNPTYLNNQTTYRGGKDSKDAKEVRQDQYDGGQDNYDAADNLREQATFLEDMGALMVPGMASAYASLLSAAVMTEQSALKMEQAADGLYRDSEMDRLDYMASQDAVIAQTQALYASYSQVRKTIPLMEKSLELQRESHRLVERQWEIPDLPAADTDRITAMNLETDIPAAFSANLSLQSNQRAFSNMTKNSQERSCKLKTLFGKHQPAGTPAGRDFLSGKRSGACHRGCKASAGH